MRRYFTAALAAAFVGSLMLNAVMMVRYRIPGFLWSPDPDYLRSFPVVPLSKTYPEFPSPRLSFSKTVGSSEALSTWRDLAKTTLADRLGVPLPRTVPAVRVVKREVVGEQIRETVVLTADDGVEIPGFLFVPPGDVPRPGVVVLPGWGAGIIATAGLLDDSQHSMALRLAEAGYVSLTLELRGMGYLSLLGPPGDDMDFGSHLGYLLMNGSSLMGRLVADAAGGLSYLQRRAEVAADQLGLVGFSLGGKAAIYLAALDERVGVVVTSGSLCPTARPFGMRFMARRKLCPA